MVYILMVIPLLIRGSAGFAEFAPDFPDPEPARSAPDSPDPESARFAPGSPDSVDPWQPCHVILSGPGLPDPCDSFGALCCVSVASQRLNATVT
jgi:hypothetical protein